MLGKELRDYRKEHGYLQKEIAETLGISASLLSRIERGKREVTVEEERKILELFPELAKENSLGNTRSTLMADAALIRAVPAGLEP